LTFPAQGVASFSSKSSIQDATDPTHVVGIDGGATLTITVHDGTVTPSNTMAVQVLSSKGGMWFSSD
jgi:hypothetical protein